MKVFFSRILGVSCFALILSSLMLSCGAEEEVDNRYVLTVQPALLAETYPDDIIFASDTVQASSVINAYAKGVQRYAAALMHLGKQELEDIESEGIQIQTISGQDVVQHISQEQRDSIIMDFIKFARRSDIPYYEHVKDFDLKIMKIR